MALGTACGAYLMFVAVVLAGIWQPAAGQQQPPHTGGAVPTGPAEDQQSPPHGGTDLSGPERDTTARRGPGSRPPSRIPAPPGSSDPA
ncbi:hypothetical protein ITI46_21850, partial [Streptomyces oryzae]|nr:hypothetical protein [Streptomyces oryzae]